MAFGACEHGVQAMPPASLCMKGGVIVSRGTAVMQALAVEDAGGAAVCAPAVKAGGFIALAVGPAPLSPVQGRPCRWV